LVFNWDSLVPLLIDPVEVAMIEAMEVPVSPRELDRIFDEQFRTTSVERAEFGLA
jgi:hypothetical protein